MKLDNGQLYELLVEKGISYLYHSNTVSTSMTFVQQGGLLSRGAVERMGLIQTTQSSDEIDKRFNVWYDIFVDSVDLHGYFPRQNLYGPISFKLSIDFLLEKDYDVWVTKDNPIYWSDAMTDSDRYFTNVSELREKWDLYQRQKKMITIRNQSAPILFEYITEVLIDDPRVKIGETILINESVKGLRNAVASNGLLMNKFKLRECRSCYCRENYLNQVPVSELKKLFLPHNHPEFNN